MDELLTLEEVCARLRVKRSWCYNDKSLPWIKVGKLKRLYAKDLETFLESGRQATIENFMRRTPGEKVSNKPNTTVDPSEPMD